MKIGFIAMSGLRICDMQLLKLGLSFPGVTRRAQTIEALPSLGLLTLAGMTPPHIGVEYLEVRDVKRDALPADYDVVALSTLTATAKEAYALAARFRANGTYVILGGLHATLVSEEARRHVDSIVIGEGETVWPEIIADLERGELKPVYDARNRPFDLADAPMPRFDLLAPGRYPRFTVQTQRGCPWSCEFCAASIRLAPAFKTKPVEKVIAEIRRIKELWREPFIEFADDNTFVNRAHSKQLMRALEREQVRWFTETDISVAQDDELLRLMRDAGCAQVLIGLEAPAHHTLEGVEQNSNWKARQYSHYVESIQKIQSHGITVNGCFVMGMDGSGPESFAAMHRFARESGLYDVQVTYLTPFPGTPLYARLLREGRILREGAWEYCTLFDINFQPLHMTAADLEHGFKSLVAKLYHVDFAAEREEHFIRQYRAGRKRRWAAA